MAGLRDLPVNVVVTTGPDADPPRIGALPPHDAVAASVQRLLGEPAFTVAARRIQAEIDAMPTAADALVSLLATE